MSLDNGHDGPKETGKKEDRPSKRVRKEKPDVTIVVGGKEFRHYRQVLCLASDYFDAALNSGMKEAETLRIEFQDKDPDEWELFASFLEPLSHSKVTVSNVETLIPWFHEFGASALLEECDRVYQGKVVPESERGVHYVGNLSSGKLQRIRKDFRALVDAFKISVIYGLPNTQMLVASRLNSILLEKPQTFDLDCVNSLVSLMLQHQEVHDFLWATVKLYLPSSLHDEDPHSLVSNKLFPHLILSQVERRVAKGHQYSY